MLLAPGLHAQEALTLDRALSLAEDRSRQLAAQDNAAAGARAMAVAAGQRPDPILKAGINNLPVDGADRFSLGRDFMTMRSVGVTQEFTRADKLQARAARYERQADVASASRELALADLQRETATAWLDRLYQERLHDILVTQRDETRLQIDAADAAYRGGRGSQADVFAARSAVAQMDDRIDESARQVATARLRLARWVGPPASDPLGAPPPLDAVALRSEDMAARLAAHPQIVVMRRQEAVAQAEADIAQADKKADVSVELMYSQRGSAYSNMVSLNVSIPLQWDRGNRQDRTVSARLATVEQMRADREEALRERVVEALALLEEWHSDRERLTRYDGSLIPLSNERTRASIAAYRGASVSLTAVLEARRAEIDIRVERLRLEMDAARLWARLSYLLPASHAMALAAQP